MIKAIKTFVSIITSLLCLFSSFLLGDFTAPYSPKKDNCKLNFAVISDVHMTEAAVRQSMLELGLYDMENAETELDALVLSGDTTNKAYVHEYEMVKDAFTKYTPAKNIILAVGNHDLWNNEVDGEDRFPESERLFIKYNKEIANREIDKVYYSTVVNGYTFIVMGSEYDSTDAYISDAQLAWLDAEMAKATADGKPVFVISHWPFKGTHGLPNTWMGEPAYKEVTDPRAEDGHFGEQNDEVKAIMKKYQNVILISGHLHNGIANSTDSTIYGYATVEDVDGITSVNLPSYINMTVRGAISAGTGLQFEVYENEVLIRARSFTGGVWYTQSEFSIRIKQEV